MAGEYMPRFGGTEKQYEPKRLIQQAAAENCGSLQRFEPSVLRNVISRYVMLFGNTD